MSAIDDLIKRAIETTALPVEEIQQFAEEVGRVELFETLTQEDPESL